MIILKGVKMNIYINYFIRVILSVILGGLIGIERGISGHDAGIKTHAIVCLGACLVGILAKELIEVDTTSIARITSAIISGIGFLGAGVIITDETKTKVVGLTTAAALWFSAIVGLLIGINFYIIAIFGVISFFIITTLFTRIEKRYKK